VRRWWGDPLRELAEINDHLKGRDVCPYLVGQDGRPFGYVQCYDAHAFPNDVFDRQPAGTRGIDFFIGEPEMLGRGHGSAMLAQFVRGVLRIPGVGRVISDPDPSNAASIAALRGAGFVDQGRVSMPDGPALLIICERPR
jgi:aminoglycoside 6'-N-acetyltransferase